MGDDLKNEDADELNFKPESGHFGFRGPHSWRLFARYWKTTNSNRKACIVAVHGYTEHSGRYGHFADFLNRAGYDFVMMDLPGHGESEGRKSNIDRFEDYVESYEAFYRAARLKGFKGPYVLFAHSLGGLIALRFLQTSPYAKDFSKAFLSSPLLGLSDYSFHGVGKLVQSELGMSLLGGATSLIPNLTLSNESDLGGVILTHDEKMSASRDQDPLIVPQVTINWTREFIRARAKAFKDVKNIKTPLGIFQAGDDRVVSSSEPERFFGKLGSVDKLYRVYEGLYHEILNEKDRARVMKDMLAWLES